MQNQYSSGKTFKTHCKHSDFVICCYRAIQILKENKGITLPSFQRVSMLSNKTARLVLSETAEERDGEFYLKQEGRRE